MAEIANEFTPRMPEVDPRTDLARVFADVRAQIAHPDPKSGVELGQRCLGIMTPGRLTMMIPAPKPDAVPAQFVEQARRLVPSDAPLQIAAVSFTELKPLMQDKLKCIPFLAQLIGLAFIGHNVLVFEGHPSAFEAGVRDCDALLIDSGMLPFLAADWAAAAFRVMRQGGRIFVFNRKTGALMPVIKSDSPQGWKFGEPDGEASYANCLLTTLAKRPPVRVQLAAGRPAPDLGALALDPKERDWAAELPFRYDRIDAAKVAAIIRQFAKLGDAASGQLRAKLATGGGKVESVAFSLQLTEDQQGLEIERI